MANEDATHKKKIITLENAESSLSVKVAKAESKLLQQIIDKFVDKLDVKSGNVVSNGKNINLTTAIDKIVNEFNRTTNTNLMKSYASDVTKNTETNKKFFGRFEEAGDTDFKKLSDEVKKTTLSRLGIGPSGSLKKGGFIDSFTNDKRLNLELKEIVTKSITTGASVSDMKREIKQYVTGGGGRQGNLTAHYRTFIFDTFLQIDRLETSLYAESLGLKAFRYVGGKINTTRHFCCQRNNLVFTVEEARKWSSLSFQGKNTPYNPLIDLGGYNCRHSTQFISNRRTASIRNDLKISNNGKLVKDSSGTRQLLNQC